MSKIFIYGVPGTGKTHFSKILAKKLDLPLLEGDKIKWQTRKGTSKKDNPLLYLGTCQAYKQFGELNRENAVKGLLAVRQALSDSVTQVVKDYDSLILEGAFLDPNSLKEFGKFILLTTLDEKKHKQQFLSHREKLLDFQGNEFKAARMVQEYLITEAKSLEVEIIDSDA